MMKFRERFMMGEVPFDDIFSLTDKWNFSDEACTLREYLGLTAKEEDVWISDSDDALEELMEKEKNTKAVFLDLDGTLFTDEKTFSAGNCQAIEEALAAGHHIVISTGRPLASAIMQAKELGFTKKGCFVISLTAVKSTICTAKRVFSKNRLQCRSFAAFLTKPFSAVFTARPIPTVRSLQSTIPKR